ncbi:MAG: DNA topoisomerase IB, partial [Pyrinomonadaceae bacterium]|nr:DNA topoisomerase IB [Pyrinomonadaceae bacterium]
MAIPAGALATSKRGASAIETIERGRRARWWRRRGTKGRGFWYEDALGQRITREEDMERIASLVIPPAWTHVRISPSARSSLQAIGLDASGRVQYLYHPQFAARQQRRKFEKIERFGERLPALRRKTNEDIAQSRLSRERVLAVVVRLINDLYFRVGSEESVERYRTYGITTLRNRHLEIKRGGRLIFTFVGKHHIRHRRIVVDEELATLMGDIKKIGGSKLFNYIDEDGIVRPIKPRDVNDYIKAAAGPEFSAKDFRTWGGTLLAAIELAEEGKAEDERQAKRKLVQAVRRVAERLGNTPTVCRNCYIHPAVLDSYLAGQTLKEFRRKVE